MIRIEHVSKTFREKKLEVKALQDVSIHVEKGDIYGIVGFSGAGKSTLIRLVNKLERPDSGSVMIAGRSLDGLRGKELYDLRRRIGMVFQQFNLLEGKTVYHNIAIPLLLEHRSKAEIDKRVSEVLAFVELTDKRDAFVSQLSGGQKQRVGIARALATSPEILLCDEATSALDPQTTDSILRLLKRVNNEMGITILLITHQMSVIQLICNKVAVMESGKVVEEGRVLDVFGQPRSEVTKRFVRTVINDQIPEALWDIIRGEKRPYRLERLKFIGDSVKEPVIADLCKRQGVEVNIVGAIVSELQQSIMSVFILQIFGKDEQLDEAEDYIDRSGVIRQRLTVNWDDHTIIESGSELSPKDE